MRAGELDRRVTLQHRELSDADTQGERTETFVTYATVWAKKREVTERERFTAQQVQAELDAIFTIRYRNDVLATDRLICEGRTYNIRPGREIGRREGLDLAATAVVS